VVERPLRLNFQVSPERISKLVDQAAFLKLSKSKKKGENGQREIEAGEALQKRILAMLENLESEQVYKNREEFTKLLKNELKMHNITVGAPMLKAILTALSEKDETADVCMKNKTDMEPDTGLRDSESVPLKEDVQEYFEREVLPHVPDAWIDESKEKIGYEIPFTRQFYKYTALRNSSEIMDEIKDLEAEIMKQLKQVME